MSRLIPTAIVDVNGRQTTVHKRAEEASKAHGALAGVKPSLGSKDAGSGVHTIKPKKLPAFADAVRLGRLMGALSTEDEVESFRESSGRSPVQMSDEEIYDALRCGIPMQDTAALKNLGITPNDVMERTKDAFMVGGALNMVSGRNNRVHRTSIKGALARLQASGMPAPEADKLMLNGLQDGHFGRALNEGQLQELFAKWRFRSEAESYEHGPVEQDDVIDGFISGRLPFEALRYKLDSLKNVERELYNLYNQPAPTFRNTPTVIDVALAERLNDMDYRASLVDAAARSMPNKYDPLKKLDEVVQKHGMEALELNDPIRASMTIFVSPGVSRECGVEAAKYVESVLDMAAAETEGDLWGTNSDPSTSQGAVKANGNYLRNWELLDLYENGVPAEVSYDMIVKHGLSREQILVARETGVSSTLANGVL
jgi:hypothetical protein